MAGETLETHDRVTMTLSAHHQHHGNDPTSCAGRYNRFLEFIEDPYKRNIKVSPTKTKLDVGWLEEPAYLFIENRVGLTKSTIPSPEEKAEEISDFADFVYKRYEENLLVSGIQKIISESDAFEFLNSEEEVYSITDLKEIYNG